MSFCTQKRLAPSEPLAIGKTSERGWRELEENFSRNLSVLSGAKGERHLHFCPACIKLMPTHQELPELIKLRKLL